MSPDVLAFLTDAGVVGVIVVATGALLLIVTKAIRALSRGVTSRREERIVVAVRAAVAESFAERDRDHVTREEFEALREDVRAIRRDLDEMAHGPAPQTERGASSTDPSPAFPPALDETNDFGLRPFEIGEPGHGLDDE